MMQGPQPEDLMTTTQAATAAGMSTSTIIRAANRGDLPVAQRNGNRRMFRWRDVDAWRHRGSPASGPAQPPRSAAPGCS